MAEERIIHVSNINEKVTKDLLEEIFTQAGPVESVSIMKKSEARYAFVQFVDEESVLYSIKLMDQLKLHGTPIRVRPRQNTENDQLYFREQHSNRRRHSWHPSRSDSSNNYVPEDQSHHNRRSLNENFVNIQPRSSQTSQSSLPGAVPVQDVTATPIARKRQAEGEVPVPEKLRIVGGYYLQLPHNPPLLHSHHNHENMSPAYRAFLRPNLQQFYDLRPTQIRRRNSNGRGRGQSWH